MAETANVDILINAFTESAKDAVEEVGDELTELTGQAQPAQSAMDEVGDELDDATTSAAVASDAIDQVGEQSMEAAGSSYALQSAVDEAGDELRTEAASAGIASGALSGYAASSLSASGSTRLLSTAVMGALVPSLLMLATVLFPLTATIGAVAAGFVGLAGAFGLAIGSGVITHLQELKQAVKEVIPPIKAAIDPIGELFGPLLLQAVYALPDLVENILAAIGPMNDFAWYLSNLGEQAAEVLPSLIGTLADLGREALPMLMDLVQFLRSEGPGAFRGMMRVARETGPVFLNLVGAIGRVVPELTALGTVVTNLVVPAMINAFNAVDNGISRFMELEESIRNLGVAGLITAPAIVAIASALGGITGPIGIAIAAITSFVAAYKTDFMGVQQITNDVVSEVQDKWGELVDFVGALDTGGLTSGIQGAASAYVDLVTDIGGMVIPILGRLESTLASNERKLMELSQIGVNAATFLIDAYRNQFLPMMRFVWEEFTIPLLNRLVTVFQDNFGTILNEVILTINAMVAAVQPALTMLENLWTRHGDTIMTATRFAFDVIVGVIGTAMDAAATALIVLMRLMRGDFSGAVEAVADFWVDAFLGMKNFIEDWNIVTIITNIVRNMINGIKQFLTRDLPQLFVIGLATIMAMTTNWGQAMENTFLAIFNGIVGIVSRGINGLVNSTIRALNDILATIDLVADQVSEIPGVENPDIGRLEQTQIDTARLQRERGAIANRQAAGAAAQELRATLDIDTSGGGPLEEFIEERAQAKVDQTESEKRRRFRRSNVGGS